MSSGSRIDIRPRAGSRRARVSRLQQQHASRIPPFVVLRIECVTSTLPLSLLRQLHRIARRESVERFSRHHAKEEKSESCRCTERRVHVAAVAVAAPPGVWMEFINARLRRLWRYGAIRRRVGPCRARAS